MLWHKACVILVILIIALLVAAAKWDDKHIVKRGKDD